MEIKTTEEIIKEDVDVYIDDCDHNETYMGAVAKVKQDKNNRWVAVDDLINDLDRYIDAVERCMGNDFDRGYKDALESVKIWIEESLSTSDNPDSPKKCSCTMLD